MQLSFPSDKSVEITFKVGIAGTQAMPQKVAVVLEKGSTSLSFNAEKTGEEWKAEISCPGATFGIGEVRLNINVLLNNRLFTPLKTVAQIEPPEEQLDVSAVKPAPEEANPFISPTVPEPIIQVSPSMHEAKIKGMITAMQDAINSKKIEIKPTPSKNLIKSFEPKVAPKHEPKHEPKQVPEAQATETFSTFSIKKTKVIIE